MSLSFKRIQNGLSHWICGPGGLKCSCCRKAPKSIARKMTSRVFRRRTKQILRKMED